MKKASRILVASAILIASWSTTSFADKKSHRKAAEDLLQVVGVEKQLQTAIDQMLDVQVKANPAIAPYKETMRSFLMKHMSWSGLKEDLITIYVDAFTEKELKEIKSFYLTPTGKKMARMMPELMSKGMQLGVKRVQDNQSELRQMIQDAGSK